MLTILGSGISIHHQVYIVLSLFGVFGGIGVVSVVSLESEVSVSVSLLVSLLESEEEDMLGSSSN